MSPAGAGARRRIGGAVKQRLDFLAFAVLSRLPIDLASAFGGWVARLRGPTRYRDYDARATAQLRRLRPDLDAEAVAAWGLRRWDNVGRVMSEFAVLNRVVETGRVKIEGAPHLRALLAGGRGFVLLGVHLGNWEVWGPVLTSLGAAPTSFYEPRPTASRERLAQKVRERAGVVLLPPGLAGLKPAVEALRSGRPLAVFADEERGGVVQGPFLARPPHSRGNLGLAVRLARQADVPILPGYILREGGARFRAVILPPLEPPTGSLVQGALALNAVIEPLVLAHLDQWYYLHFPLSLPPPPLIL